ncbi:AAA family ATPase [Mesorhizobium sp. M0618]|uniref:ATP-dependent DNA helicase n=1 Tax=Mesorhizobium sp. M0618 TaxID=2956972 RepID=UPI0033372AAB
MTLAIPPSSLYNLNAGQMKAAEKFLEFLFSPDKEFIISGPAGVGKTYLMNYIIDNTMPRYLEMCKLLGVKPEYTEVVMTATTNKAAEVLSKSTKRPTSTACNHFNLVVYDDFKTGQAVLKQTAKWRVHQKQIIFIDEASMIDTQQWKMFHEGTMDCKLVYVGDHNQLAPVHEDLSPVYKHGAPMIELLEPVRNAGQPALMAICQQLRDTVATGVFKPIKPVPGVIDLLNGPQMQSEINRVFAQQTHEARILAFTNRRVIEYNDYIRTYRQLPASFQAGELLVNNTVLHTKQGNISVEAELEVLRNHGPTKVMIDDEHSVWLDVDVLDLQNQFGDVIRSVQFPTDREHFNELVKYYNRSKNWMKKTFLKNNFADLRQHDSATVHKSQGSTYETVFVDLGNISTCNVPSQVARMLYVAFSRARNRVILFGDLAQKYGGLDLS